MLVYRIVRLALASGPFHSEMYKYPRVDKNAAILILKEIVNHVSHNRMQGGLHYDVHPQIIQMSEMITKDADIFFILHEIYHVQIEDDEVSTLIQMLIWGTLGRIPELNDISDHEILADRLACTSLFGNFYATRNYDYYEKLKVLNPKLMEDIEISALKKKTSV